MRTTPTITALLLALCAASALAHSISVPMAHVQRRDPWWQQTRKRDVIAGLDNLRPPDVWTVNVTVGSPPQVFPVNIDTGSTDLLIATPVCAECNTQPGLRFQAADSATFAALSCDDSRCDEQCVDCRRSVNQCRFNNTYGDGTWAFGDVGADVISLNNLTSTTPITFGVMTQTVPEFYINASVSGIFGLAFASSSCWGQNSALLNLFDQNPTVPRTFSLCLLPDGGEMTVGERFPPTTGAQDTTDPAAASQPVSTIPYAWTRYTTEGVFAGYGVNLRDVEVGGQSLGVSFRRLAIVDSGTTVVTIPTAAYNALTNKLLDSCAGTACDLFAPSNYFLPATLADIQQLPDIAFVFNGVTLTLTPLQYLSAGSSARDLWFFLIFPTDGTPIIGNQVMKYFRTAFDLENERIGFASAASACEGGDVWGPGAIVTTTAAAQDNSGIDFSAAASVRASSAASIAALALLAMFIIVA